MSYETYRVEITRDETRDKGAVTIEITAYIDRVPETDAPTRGMLTRASRGVWNSRLQFTGDFETLPEALAAIDAAHPDATAIRCREWAYDYDFPVDAALLVKTEGKWAPSPAA
ncbi:MAG TPA: hypothetical protein VHW66_23765 [Stellaceae bacterium]|jgi:hypothetical protein|nr:hypothetical protein [Stellaceae bacterium]